MTSCDLDLHQINPTITKSSIGTAVAAARYRYTSHARWEVQLHLPAQAASSSFLSTPGSKSKELLKIFPRFRLLFPARLSIYTQSKALNIPIRSLAAAILSHPSNPLLITRRLRSFQRSINALTPRNLLLPQTLIPIITNKIPTNTLSPRANL